ncbi:MAG: VaFE repeat-containing surface-anchored protein, partial [Tissierellia bacterium]|nr:VaFE repeat-containing surface-anchored protein [Tissierellia bacterium]
DLEDKDQTISVPKPELKTKFADVNGSKTVKALGKVKFVDNVEYKNLIVGKEYTLTLTVMNKDTNKPITDAKGNVLTSTTTFTATKPNGVEKVEMTIDLTGYKTVELVAFEKLSHKGIDIALHEDINDKDQTVKIVEPAKPNNPKTNDTFKALGFVVAISVATLGLFVLTAKKKRLTK